MQAAIKNDGVVEIPEESFIITEPLFMGPKYPEHLCWTLIKSNLKDEFINTLAVRVIQDDMPQTFQSDLTKWCVGKEKNPTVQWY